MDINQSRSWAAATATALNSATEIVVRDRPSAMSQAAS
jgi:hypothetical protein